MTSVAGAYAGRPDPTPDIDPVTSHTVTAEASMLSLLETHGLIA